MYLFHRSILKHKDLGGLVQTSSLGSLLLEEDLTPREEQYLTHKEVLDLNRVASQGSCEERSWGEGLFIDLYVLDFRTKSRPGSTWP